MRERVVHQMAAVARARAYVYCGEWVADCPRDCGNVEFLCDLAGPHPSSPRTKRKPSFHCSYCKQVAVIEWPDNGPEIQQVLALRPIPHTRNWYPREHVTAMRHRVEHGQSVEELRAENLAHGVPAEPGGTCGEVG